MKYYIGIDGGGTKTKFLVGRMIEGTGTDGSEAAGLEVIGEYTGGSCFYLQVGFDGLESVIREGLPKACANAGIQPGDVAFAFAGCAGYEDTVRDQPMIEEAMRRGFGDMPYAAGNDCENALEGALGGRPGINIIAGTGSIGGGRNADGKFLRAGGGHHVLGGDEGSAYWIAWNLLKEFVRQSDGRDAKTLLYSAVNEALSLNSDDELVTRVVTEWDLDRKRIAGLAPVVSRLYEEGDPYAAEILTGCARELSDIAIALYDRLGFTEADGLIPASGTGGVFKIGPAVTEPFAEALRAHGMQYVEAADTPDMGALMLAVRYGKQYGK